MKKEVLSTVKYDMFKRLSGNRGVSASRVNKIKNSILSVGYITSPIIVNENFEVIDGQGRLEALKQLSLPVEYIIHKNAGINECRAMNLYQTNWNMTDYIESYAEEGIDSYVILNEFVKKYKKLGLNPVINAITGLDGADTNSIKSGLFSYTNEDGRYAYAEGMLDYELKFTEIAAKIHGNKQSLFMAIGYAYKRFGCNQRMEEILLESLTKYYLKAIPFSNKVEALDTISSIYNMCVKGKNKIYLKSDYEKEMNNAYPWYNKKWLELRRAMENNNHMRLRQLRNQLNTYNDIRLGDDIH